MAKRRHKKDCDNEGLKEDMELTIIDFIAIANATIIFQATRSWEKVDLDLCIRWTKNILTIREVYFLATHFITYRFSGYAARRPSDSCEEAFKEFWTRA